MLTIFFLFIHDKHPPDMFSPRFALFMRIMYFVPLILQYYVK
nr:MAG TPA_asm: hypothetical protein [Caudoviricetes sp.]